MVKNNSDELTPLMRQYQEIKKQYSEVILLFRLGDFYEMFDRDAIIAAPLLNLVLTRRQNVPMCGIPYHSIDNYIARLIQANKKVAICEQTEKPAPGKKLLQRSVQRLITPGTAVEENLLTPKNNNYLAAIYTKERESLELAYLDVNTGKIAITSGTVAEILQLLNIFNIREIITTENLKEKITPKNPTLLINGYSDDFFSLPEPGLNLNSLLEEPAISFFNSLRIESPQRKCLTGLFNYLRQTYKTSIPKIFEIAISQNNDYLYLDESAVRNLELTENLLTHQTTNSLLEVIDLTLTPMGGRLLRQWLLKPLFSVKAIATRQQQVYFWAENDLIRQNIRHQISSLPDIERLLNRIFLRLAGPREVGKIKSVLQEISAIKKYLSHTTDNWLIPPENIIYWKNNLAELPELQEYLTSSLNEELPQLLRDGGIIRTGYDKELDEYRRLTTDTQSLFSEIEKRERARTGINNLRIGYNSVFGYYLEVTKSNFSRVPPDYIRKQTLTNCERFITPELKQLEEKINFARQKISEREEYLFEQVIKEILKYHLALRKNSELLAELDCYLALAEVGRQKNWVLPEISEENVLEIKEGRHPVVEKNQNTFVPNDTYLDTTKNQIIILTGPNMAGKSTYLRQVAIITILAQIGSLVPATAAKIGLVDKIFTRIGAMDNLSQGESTFMIEMRETAKILHQATARSLLILDEIGRGTSTYDGISIAQATLEYLSNWQLYHPQANSGPRTLFATHYFEVTELARQYPNVHNYNVSVREWNNELIFLHQIIPGPADRSYGIQVAKLAGLPPSVISRARTILRELEEKSVYLPKQKSISQPALPQESNLIMTELSELDSNNLTPLEALNIIARWKKIINRGES